MLADKAAVEAAQAAQAAEEAQLATEAANTAPAPSVQLTEPVNGYKAFIYDHESGNNPGSINAASGACGLGQAWPCAKMPCSLSDYACQDAFFDNYAISRYGSWYNAYLYWIAHQNW